MPQVASRPRSLTLGYRVSYLDGEEGPQAEVAAARRDVVRLHRALRRRHALHRHHEGREPPLPAAQRRDRLQIHSQPSPRQAGLSGASSQPEFGLEAGGGDQGDDPARKIGDGPSEKEGMMTPLYEDPHFTFRFEEDRIIPRFHLEGIEAGRWVNVFKIDPQTGERLGLLATATEGEGGWVKMTEPIIVRGGKAFLAVHSAGDNLYRIVGPATWQTDKWAFPVFPTDADGLLACENKAANVRRRLGREPAVA